jgi:spermidine/putrescine transport system permease protein
MLDKLESRAASIILYGSIIASLIFFYVPIVTLVVFSLKEGRYLSMPIEGWTFDWYRELFNNRDIGSALRNSATVATAAMLASTLIGLGAALAWVRYRFRGKTLFQAISIGPLLFPQLLLAVIILFWFTVLSNWLGFSNGIPTAIIGHVVYLTPFATIIIAVQAAGLDPTIEQAAQDCGANSWQVFYEVTLPLLWPGIFSALTFSFLLSWGNFYLTYSLAGGERTLPTFVFSGIAMGSTPIYPALASVTFAIGLCLLVVADMIRRRAAAKLKMG